MCSGAGGGFGLKPFFRTSGYGTSTVLVSHDVNPFPQTLIDQLFAGFRPGHGFCMKKFQGSRYSLGGEKDTV